MLEFISKLQHIRRIARISTVCSEYCNTSYTRIVIRITSNDKKETKRKITSQKCYKCRSRKVGTFSINDFYIVGYVVNNFNGLKTKCSMHKFIL